MNKIRDAFKETLAIILFGFMFTLSIMVFCAGVIAIILAVHYFGFLAGVALFFLEVFLLNFLPEL